MTGPEHYQEAEQLLSDCKTRNGTIDEDAGATLAAAHVHALLALTAATALKHPGGNGGMPVPDAQQWEDVCSAGRQ